MMRGVYDDAYRYSYGHGMYNESNYVFADAHVLGSPTLVDVNGDGHMEVIVAISYYFDRVEYAAKDVDFTPGDYIAGGIGCWDLEEEDWTWLVHLDLTTDKSKFKALVYGTPTVADIDGDGRAEVLIGTSLGLLYMMDGETGFVKRYFPMQFHEIQSQIAVADVRGGPGLEIIGKTYIRAGRHTAPSPPSLRSRLFSLSSLLRSVGLSAAFSPTHH
jgi:hypothetical protein